MRDEPAESPLAVDNPSHPGPLIRPLLTQGPPSPASGRRNARASTARLTHAPCEAKPFGTAIHATAVAIGGCGLLILGPSGAGKSRLAAALVAASTSRRPIRLIGDDRILLSWRGADLIARPHPRIAGFIERRGLGIVACPFVATAVVRGAVRLDERGFDDARSTTPSGGSKENFPDLPFVTIDRTWLLDDQRDAVLGWCRDACTTPAAKTTVSA